MWLLLKLGIFLLVVQWKLMPLLIVFCFVLIVCLFFGGPVVSSVSHPLIQKCYPLIFLFFFFQGCTGAQCIFRLVLLGHTGYTTCNFRTTKQILFLFFVLLRIRVRACVCVSVCCLQQSVRACVWFLTASCLGLKHFLCWTWRSQTGECKLSPEVVLNVFYEVIVEM